MIKIKYTTLILAIGIGLLIYTISERKATMRHMNGNITDNELTKIVQYLYSLHEFSEIDRIQTSKDGTPIYKVLFNDGSSIEYFVFRERYNKYSHSIINSTND